jgi:UDP-N-acetylmuramate dehydrogenase
MRVQQNVALAPFTTLGIGGPARWFLVAEREEDVVEAVAFAREREVPLFVLGGGSNLVVRDQGFPGAVLRIEIPGVHAAPSGEPGDATAVLLQSGAGENWDALVQHAVTRNLAGMECLAGIPGTVGGTPVQNVGAYGQEVSETIAAVRCFDTERDAFVELSNADCQFGYRTSVLNTSARGRYIVTRVDFRLQQGGPPALKYADLRKHFGDGAAPSLTSVAEAVRTIRRSKGMVIDPADADSRSAGSFFRNPIVPGDRLAFIAAASGIETPPHWPAGSGRIKLPAAWLVEQAGFGRGYAMGRAGISSRHTLALINRGGATAAELLALRDRIITGVQQRFGVELEQEPVLLGTTGAGN